MSAELEITDQVVAAFLSDRGRSRYLDPYLARECSVAAAAAMLGVSPQKMHYWTRELQALRLIRQVRTEVRGRHHSRIYRSVADAFTVPLEHLPTDDVETLALYFDPIWQSFLRSVSASARKYSPGWSVRYSRMGEQPAFHIVPTSEPAPEAEPAFTNSWARLDLTREQAQELKAELEKLLNRYLDQPQAGNRRQHIAHVALVESV